MAERLTVHPPCGRRFAEELLSGYLDDALTQGDDQRVRLHLEDCPNCRAQVEEMSKLREVTMSTRFVEPRDDQWDERPRGTASRLSRGVGWLLVVAWLAIVAGFAAWQFATSPEALTLKTFVFAGVLGVVLLFLSVVIDRVKAMKTDRYRGIEK